MNYASELLKTKWDRLDEGNHLGQKGYFAGLERIERRQKPIDEESEPTETSRKEAIPTPQQKPIEHDAGCLRDIASLILDEYPHALSNLELLIDVLGRFGFPDDPWIRSQAVDLMQEMKEDSRVELLAAKINNAERRGI